MRAPTQEQTASLESRWTPLWRWLWRCIQLLWVAFILGILDSIIATRVTSDKDFPVVSPVGRAMQNLPFTLLLGLSLLLLTALVWVLSRQRPSQRALLPSEQNRLALIRTLRQEYTRQLNHSLQGAAMMALHLHERTDLTLSSAQLVFHRTGGGEEHALPPGTSIVEAYDDAGGGLLILGEPGAGKTTLLLALAQELFTRAEGDPTHPIPVIVNLSSWAIKQPPLASWLIEQLQLVYQVPTRLSKAWLEHDQWLLLLDGLDEVEASARVGCIKAINTYHGEHFTSLVVCSRKHEYLSQEARLALPTAVVVQPLQAEQVTAYLKGIGNPMAAVRAALRTNPTFQHIITTPLMLNVVILAYRDKAVKDLPSLGSAEQQQQQIFDRYVERMLARPVTQGAFKPQQIQYWLTWLAHVMQQQHLSEFYLEYLQPAWLPSKRSQMRYSLLVRLLFGLLIGLLIGLPIGLSAGLSAGLLFGLLIGLPFGLLSGLSFGLRFASMSHKIHLTDVLNWSWKNFWPRLRFGLLIGLLSGLLIGLVTPAKQLSFSVGNLFANRLLIGLLSGVFIGLLIGLPRGFSTSQIVEQLRIKPNQGIRSSGQNALFVGLITVLLWLPFVLLSGLLSKVSTGPLSRLLSDLLSGLFIGLLVGLPFGGTAYLQHYMLRYLLWRSGAMPWHYIRFLEEASERILLLKVGGGYRFIHPLFLDYFASQSTAIPSDSTEQPPPQQPSSSSPVS